MVTTQYAQYFSIHENMNQGRCSEFQVWYIDGLVQARSNSSVLAIELHVSCIDLSINGVKCFLHLPIDMI